MKIPARFALIPLLVLACDAGGAYLYTGNLYNPQNDCLGTLMGLDVLEGTDPGATCAAKCIAAKNADDGGAEVFISTMCGPAPYNADVSGSSSLCAPALSAQSRGAFCDAGSD
jgi:hypothetical protein